MKMRGKSGIRTSRGAGGGVRKKGRRSFQGEGLPGCLYWGVSSLAESLHLGFSNQPVGIEKYEWRNLVSNEIKSGWGNADLKGN